MCPSDNMLKRVGVRVYLCDHILKCVRMLAFVKMCALAFVCARPYVRICTICAYVSMQPYVKFKSRATIC